MSKRIRKAVIPAAGLGTRFLPATKAIPKELLPLVDKPVIQHTIEEAVASGIEQIFIVTSKNKEGIESHFRPCPELESALERKGDTELLEKVRGTCSLAEIQFVVQDEPRGLGHAVLTAADLVGNEPFAVFLPDDLFDAEPPVIVKMCDIYSRFGGCVIALLRVDQKDINRYGIVKPEPVEDRIYRIIDMVEKPPAAEAPSNLAIMGRYVLPPEIFDALRATSPGKGGEIQLTDAIARLIDGPGAYGYEFDGKYLDAGKPLGLLKTSILMGLRHPEFGAELREYLRDILRD